MAPTSRSSTVLQKLRVAFSSHFFASSIFFILRNTVPSIRSFLPEKFGSTSAYKKKSKLMSPAFLACRTGTIFSRFSGEHEADVERWGRRGKITPVHALLFFRAFTSLRKQPIFPDATTGFPAKGRLRNERRNSILMTQ